MYVKSVRFTSVRRVLALCVLCLGSKRHVRISALDAFTNTIYLTAASIYYVCFFIGEGGVKNIKG